MSVAGVVMAHKKRETWAEELSVDLGLPIVWDQVNDRHETGLRCLRAGLDHGATHHVVVQDDGLPCRDLLDGLAKATEFSGDRIVGLYVGNTGSHADRLLKTARSTGRSWMVRPRGMVLWGVALVIPTVHLPELIRGYEKSREQNYDRRIEHWADQHGVDTWFTVPSLVDHRHGDENPSLVPGRTSTSRHARWYIGADASAVDVDWSLVPLETGWWRHPRTKQVRRANGPSASRLQAQGWTPVEERICEYGGKHYVTPAAAPAPAAV